MKSYVVFPKGMNTLRVTEPIFHVIAHESVGEDRVTQRIKKIFKACNAENGCYELHRCKYHPEDTLSISTHDILPEGKLIHIKSNPIS